MTEYARPRAVGFNHVALEVGNIEEALAFYGRLTDSSCAARATPWPSSISAINSWLYRRAGENNGPSTKLIVWSTSS